MPCCLELPLKTPGSVCFVSSLQLFQSAHTIPQAEDKQSRRIFSRDSSLCRLHGVQTHRSCQLPGELDIQCQLISVIGAGIDPLGSPRHLESQTQRLSLISRWPFPDGQRCHDEDGHWAGNGGQLWGRELLAVKPWDVGKFCRAGWGSPLLAPLTSLCLHSLEGTMPRFEPGALHRIPGGCVGQGEILLQLLSV